MSLDSFAFLAILALSIATETPGSQGRLSSSPLRRSLEIRRNAGGHGARSDVVRPAESRKEVIQRILVGNVNRRQIEIQLVAILTKDVLLADCNIEEVARRYARRVLVVIFGSRRRDAYQR
jgi:hypothetical protein